MLRELNAEEIDSVAAGEEGDEGYTPPSWLDILKRIFGPKPEEPGNP